MKQQFKTFAKKHWNSVLFALFVIIISLLACNSYIFNTEYLLQIEKSSRTIPYIVLAMIVHCSSIFFILWLGLKNRIVAYILIPAFILIHFGCNYAVTRYGVATEELAIAAYNATWHELRSYLYPRTIILFAAVFVFYFILSFSLRKWSPFNRLSRKQNIKLSFGIVLLGLCSVLLPLGIKNCSPSLARQSVGFILINEPWRLSFPYKMEREEALKIAIDIDHLFEKTYIPFYDLYLFCKAIVNFCNPVKLQDTDTIPSRDCFENKPDAVILYIGESFRADHSPLNGYTRNTLPKISQQNNIINIPNLHSLATHTIDAIYRLLVLSDSAGHPTHTTFLSILKKHNYNLALLVGSNTEGMWWNTPLIAPQISPYCNLHSRPACPQQYKLSFAELLQKTPAFILVEDGAGHMPYTSSSTPFGTKSLIDWYDNSLLDIDSRVDSIIQTLKNKSAILLFTSDHGESLGENGIQGHGGALSIKEQTHCCAFIWYSDTYKKEHPEIIENLRRNAHLFASHSYIYHTILSLCGVSSELQNQSQDMTQQQESLHHSPEQ